jgi:hypothetical protein
MTSFPGSPRLLKGGLVLIDPTTKAVQRIIPLQYNPDSVSRTLQPQAIKEGGDRAEALRLTGPAVETFKVEAEIDATDQMELGERTVREVGLYPQLAVLEMLVYPTVAHLEATNRLAGQGVLEIAPAETPLTLFVWSKQRIVPVRVTDFSITEEAFDPTLNPIRAKVSLGLRVLNVNDLGFQHAGGGLFMSYLRNKQDLARRAPNGVFSALGIPGI